jgi:hypothetical protein
VHHAFDLEGPLRPVGLRLECPHGLHRSSRSDGRLRWGGHWDRPPTPTGDASPSSIPSAACYPWPTGSAPLAPEIAAGVTRYGLASLHFVRDFHDLGLLLLADTHVQRGGVWSFTPANNEPGRLTKAILLARQCGDQDLERAAVAKLRNRGDEPVPRRPDYLFRQAVADWARQYAKATGIDLSDWPSSSESAPSTPRSRSSTRLSRPGR